MGDFILTLPAIRLLREAFPDAHLEILGYRHIVAVAEGRFYADASRSIEYRGIAGFSIPRSEPDPALAEYFVGFQQVVSYLFDPDGFFEGECPPRRREELPPRLRKDRRLRARRPATRPAAPIARALPRRPRAHTAPHPRRSRGSRGISCGECAAAPWRSTPAAAARAKTGRSPAGATSACASSTAAPRSCSSAARPTVRPQLDALRAAWAGRAFREAADLPLPHLAAVLQHCRLYLGHDTGISHLAAAAGTRCVLLFGPTDPAVWAPANRHVTILEAPGGDFARITVEAVEAVLG